MVFYGLALGPDTSRKPYWSINLYDLEKGLKLQAQSVDDNAWYAAEVVMTSTSKKRTKAPVKIHYLDYTSESDEWVAIHRLRSNALKAIGRSTACQSW